MDNNRSKTQRIAKNTGFLYLRMILVMVVSLYTSRVVLRSLGFDDFGIYNVVGSVVVFLGFLQAALRNATFRYIAYELGREVDSQLCIVYSMSINTHAALAIAMFFIMEIAGIWYINYELIVPIERLYATNWVYQFSLFTFCISIFRTPFESNILAHEKMDFFALTSVVEVILKLLVVYLLLIVTIDKLIVYGFLLLIVSVIISLWYILFCHFNIQDCKYIKIWNQDIFKLFLSYSGWSVLVNAACMTRTQCVNIFFNKFLGLLANASLGIANQVISALNTFVVNFTQAFRPQLIKSWASKDYKYFHQLIFSTSKISYYMFLVISIPIMSNLDFILSLWLGEYPMMTPSYIKAIIIYFLIDAFQEPLVTAVHATGKLKTHQIMISSIVFLVIPISYMMLLFGFSGTSVLLMNSCANICCFVARTIYMKKLIRLELWKYLKSVCIPILVVTLLSSSLSFWVAHILNKTWDAVLLNIILSLLFSLLICFYFGLNKKEREILLSMPLLKKIKQK